MWGLIWGKEIELLKKSIDYLSDKFNEVNVIEIGARQCLTGKKIYDTFTEKNVKCNYYGFDIRNQKKELKENMKFFLKDANQEDALELLPDRFHLVFIDACHCKRTEYTDEI